jgi:hypothetical protein
MTRLRLADVIMVRQLYQLRHRRQRVRARVLAQPVRTPAGDRMSKHDGGPVASALLASGVRPVGLTAWVLVAASALGCAFVPEGRHTMRFELVQELPGAVVTERKSYFLWGLAPTVEVDVLDKCPYGAVAIVDGSDAGATWVPTLGIWSRRATTYYCRQPPVSQPFS